MPLARKAMSALNPPHRAGASMGRPGSPDLGRTLRTVHAGQGGLEVDGILLNPEAGEVQPGLAQGCGAGGAKDGRDY